MHQQGQSRIGGDPLDHLGHLLRELPHCTTPFVSSALAVVLCLFLRGRERSRASLPTGTRLLDWRGYSSCQNITQLPPKWLSSIKLLVNPQHSWKRLTFRTASEFIHFELQKVHLSQDKSPTNASPSYLSPQAKPEAIREPACMLLVPHKNKHCLGFCSGELHKHSTLMLMITASLQLNTGGCFPLNSFPPAPVLYQSVTPDFYHQKSDPKK